MTYHADHTCQIVGLHTVDTITPKSRRVHELDPATGQSTCAERNKAAAKHDYKPLGAGEVNCVRCERMLETP